MHRSRQLSLVAAIAFGLTMLTGCSADDPEDKSATRAGNTPASNAAPPDETTTTTTLPIPSSAGPLSLVKTITGAISPKSVVASGHGLVFAQNMMYKHSVTVYDRDGNLVATIPDTVRLSDFGRADRPEPVQGAPVEAAFTKDGSKAYVSNYSMYGPYFGPEGDDDCTPSSGYDNSYLYRIDTKTFAIDSAIEVGAVPKYVAISPDGKWILATNWCTFDLSVIDAASQKEVKRIPIGPYPRGIAISPDSRTAYIAVMGGSDIAKVDLANFGVSWIRGVGSGPRHIVISPDGASLFVTLNSEGRVAKIDTASGTVVAKVATGQAPRSMDISTDGQHVYVVNYESSTMSKLRTSDLGEVQSVKTGYHPIGVTYDRSTGAVWVANYTGSIMIFTSA